MSMITIEWYYHERDGKTCARCCDSIESIRRAVDRASRLLGERGIAIELREHVLGEDQIDRSNSLTINGRDVMDILGERGDIYTFCRSCTDLIGRPTECRTFIYQNKAYESIPEDMLVNALLHMASEAA